MVRISVIMAVYNAEEYLADAINSVLGQSLREIELLCVDDGSADQSLSILRTFEKKDSRIRVFSHENHGASFTRNKAIAAATGEYIHILDGDDMVAPGAYERMYSVAKEKELDMLFFDAQPLFDNEAVEERHKNLTTYYKREKSYSDVVTGETLFCAFSRDDVYRSQASMYLMRRAYQNTHDVLFYNGITHEDQLFTFMGILKAGRAAHINEPLFIRRVHDNSTMTASVKFKNVEGLLTCFHEMYLYMVHNITFEHTKAAAVKEISAVARSGIWKFSLISQDEQEKAGSSAFLIQLLIKAFAEPYNKQVKYREAQARKDSQTIAALKGTAPSNEKAENKKRSFWKRPVN